MRNITLRRTVNNPKTFVEQILDRVLPQSSYVELIHVIIKDNKLIIEFKNVTNESILRVKIKIIVDCIKEWNKMTEACENLAKITATAIINGYAKEV